MTISTDADKRALLEALHRSLLAGVTEIEAAAVGSWSARSDRLRRLCRACFDAERRAARSRRDRARNAAQPILRCPVDESVGGHR